MTQVSIPNQVISAIERHALRFKGKEIYGWLIGYEHHDAVKILLSIPCKTYHFQSTISAAPTVDEVHEINKIVPKGVGIVGIYHSHPAEVFHSSTDDRTVKQFSSIYPNFLSIVTNGETTKFYQLVGDEVGEISVKRCNLKDNLKGLVSVQFETELDVDISIHEDVTLPYIASQLREKLEEDNNYTLIASGKTINLTEKVKQYDGKTIKISFLSKKQGKISDHESNENINNHNNSSEAGNLLIKLQLSFDILTIPQTFKDIQSLIFRGLVDAMYYHLKHSTLLNMKLLSPLKLKIEIDKISLISNLPLENKEKMLQSFKSLLFRIDYMSFSKEKERKYYSSKISEIMQELERIEETEDEDWFSLLASTLLKLSEKLKTLIVLIPDR